MHQLTNELKTLKAVKKAMNDKWKGWIMNG